MSLKEIRGLTAPEIESYLELLGEIAAGKVKSGGARYVNQRLLRKKRARRA